MSLKYCHWIILLAFCLTAKAQTPPSATNKSEPPSQVGLELTPAKNLGVTIPRAALGQDFLLSGSSIPQSLTATSHGLAGKIVRFELFHDAVDMYESTQGQLVTTDLPARRLLTSFPIIEQNETRVVIDFNKGMHRVFTASWIGGGAFNPSASARTLEVSQSRVFEVKRDGRRLVVRQSVQVRDRQTDPNLEERFEIRYFLSPYTQVAIPNKEHGPSDARYVRYFEVAPQVEPISGRQTTKIARFNINEPIRFYYSANTPAEYEEAVREGILYWNRAFGKEVIKADKAPAGVTAPDAAHNIVQWVPYDSATFAYADALVDPISGTTQHGQAYITSVFAFSSKARVRELLRLVRSTLDHKGGKSTNSNLGIDFLQSSSLCSGDPIQFAQQFAAGLEAVLAVDQLDDSGVLRLSQDYVRKVVAHEIGHVLGLRHNFASSLTGTLTHRELDDWFRQYLNNSITNNYNNHLTSESVMDYTPFKSRLFIGHLIHTSKEALPYDKAAIQWGYLDQTTVIDRKTIFATDQDTAVYGDVRTFDYGPDPIVGAYANIGDLVRNLPQSVIEAFIRAKAPRDPRDRVPLSNVNLSHVTFANAFATEFAQILQWFKSSTRSLKVENGFDYIGDLNRKEIQVAHWKRLNEQTERIGGIDRLLFSSLPVDLKLEFKGEPKEVATNEKIDAKKLNETLAKLLETPVYTNWIGLDARTNTFTKDEKEIILNRGRKLFGEFEKEIVKRAVQTLEKAQRDLGVKANGIVGEDDIIAQLEKRTAELAKVVIMSRNDEDRRRGKVDKSTVDVVDFRYDLETRLTAARSLADDIGSFKGWAADAKGDLHKQLREEVDASLNIQNFREFNEAMLSRSLRDWYLDQQSVIGLLPAKKGPVAPSNPR